MQVQDKNCFSWNNKPYSTYYGTFGTAKKANDRFEWYVPNRNSMNAGWRMIFHWNKVADDANLPESEKQAKKEQEAALKKEQQDAAAKEATVEAAKKEKEAEKKEDAVAKK